MRVERETPHDRSDHLEVLREALVSVVREMRVTLVRTAFSSTSTRAKTSSCA